MQKCLSICDNFNMLVINFISSLYFPDPELHLPPAYPRAQITTRIVQISNTTEHKSCQKLKKHKPLAVSVWQISPDACHESTNIAVGGLIINSCFEFARSLCIEFRPGVFILCDFSVYFVRTVKLPVTALQRFTIASL